MKKKINISGCSHQRGIFQLNTGSSVSWLTTEHFCVTSTVKTPLLQGENPSQEERRPSHLQPLPRVGAFPPVLGASPQKNTVQKALRHLLSLSFISQGEISNVHSKALVMGFPS